MISARHEALERMRPAEKVRHWAQKEPWKGIRVNQRVEIGSNQIVMDERCNIIRSPTVIGKPCLGQPTAFARHGGIQPILHAVKGHMPSRCMRCSTKDACERIAKARLRVTTEVQDAYRAFERAGGAYGLNNPHDCPTAQRQFDGLVNALVRHGGFTSCNDAVAIAHYEEERTQARLLDAKKKRQARLAAARRGNIDEHVVSILEDHRRWREAQLRVAIGTAGMSPRISRLPPSSARQTADVWLARMLLTLRREPVNHSRIAREMMRRSPAHYSNHNALRQRVENDLLRIDLLERCSLPEHRIPVWPRFDLREALQLSELATPYMVEEIGLRSSQVIPPTDGQEHAGKQVQVPG